MLTAVATVLTTAVTTAGLHGGAQPVLPGFLSYLASPLEHYGLLAILAFVLLEDFGIPVPGETVLIAGAVFAGSGQLNIVAVGITGFFAAVIGDNIGYAIGRFGGRALVERWGRYVFITPERLDRAEAFFDGHGGKIITIARFIEGLRQANGLIAGTTGMHWLRFVAFNALGAALWVGTWVSVGYYAGEHITAIYDGITRYSLYAAIAAVVLIAGWIGYRLIRRKSAAVQGAEAPTSTPAGRGTAQEEAGPPAAAPRPPDDATAGSDRAVGTDQATEAAVWVASHDKPSGWAQHGQTTPERPASDDAS